MSIATLPLGNSLQDVPRPIPMRIDDEVFPLSASFVSNANTQSRLIENSERFRGHLEIPGAVVTIPDQDFISSVTASGITFESYPEDSWPKLLIEIDSDVLPGRVKSFIIKSSDNTVYGELLRTRVVFSVARTNKWLLHTNDAVVVFEHRYNPSSALDGQQLFYRAKLYRKLKYIEEFFGIQFSLPDTISGEDVKRIETVFRGITEGEFTTRGGEIIVPQISPPLDADLSQPPFTGPGEFSYKVISPVKLFGESLLMGPIKIALKRSELANKRVLDQLRNKSPQPMNWRFIVYDHQITYRFEHYACQPRKRLSQRLERFKCELASKEAPELANLVGESLEPDVSVDEATQIAMGWTLYYDLPDRYCPQEPELDSAAGQWRVPIYLVYTSGEGGPVGEVIIDTKTGEIVSHTPVEELRSKGRALAEQILHAR